MIFWWDYPLRMRSPENGCKDRRDDSGGRLRVDVRRVSRPSGRRWCSIAYWEMGVARRLDPGYGESYDDRDFNLISYPIFDTGVVNQCSKTSVTSCWLLHEAGAPPLRSERWEFQG